MPDTGRVTPAQPEMSDTSGPEYAERLSRLQNATWKKILHVQAPYHADLRKQQLGRTLEIGCGLGRVLEVLPEGSIGVDHNPHFIRMARERGLSAYTLEEFLADPELAKAEKYDSLLAAHFIEHLTEEDARTIMASYLPYLKPGGRVLYITPQERGYASDPTHLVFTDFAGLRRLNDDLGLETVREWSFPFPRWTGKPFIYNEFHVIARKPAISAAD